MRLQTLGIDICYTSAQMAFRLCKAIVYFKNQKQKIFLT